MHVQYNLFISIEFSTTGSSSHDSYKQKYFTESSTLLNNLKNNKNKFAIHLIAVINY